jgi:hypothetical protein
MFMNIPQWQWDDTMRKIRDLREELEARPTENLQGMVGAYAKMRPFTDIKSLFGSDVLERLRMGKRILTQRELSRLTEEELRLEAEAVHPFRNELQSIADFFGYNGAYAKRGIALDLLGERKGMPYFVHEERDAVV